MSEQNLKEFRGLLANLDRQLTYSLATEMLNSIGVLPDHFLKAANELAQLRADLAAAMVRVGVLESALQPFVDYDKKIEEGLFLARLFDDDWINARAALDSPAAPTTT